VASRSRARCLTRTLQLTRPSVAALPQDLAAERQSLSGPGAVWQSPGQEQEGCTKSVHSYGDPTATDGHFGIQLVSRAIYGVLESAAMLVWVMTFAVGIGCVAAVSLQLACSSSDVLPSEVSKRNEAHGVDNAEPASAADCLPELLYEELGSLPTWMAVTDEYIFWIEERAGVLVRRSKRTSEWEAVSRDVTAGWDALAGDTDSVYVGGQDGMVHRIVANSSQDIVLSETGGERASQFRVQGEYVYWLSSSGDVSRRSGSVDLRRVRADGSLGAESMWQSSRATYGLAVQGEALFVDEYTWPQSGGEPEANGVVSRISSSGAPTVTLVEDLLFPRVQAADRQYVYFSAQTLDAERRNQLWRVSIDGGPAQLVYGGSSEAGVQVGQMIADEGTVWWGQVERAGDGFVRRVSYGEDTSVAAAIPNGGSMLGLAADSDAIYFSSRFGYDGVGPGTVWRVGRHCSGQ
jgi:hypothetical protein